MDEKIINALIETLPLEITVIDAPGAPGAW